MKPPRKNVYLLCAGLLSWCALLFQTIYSVSIMMSAGRSLGDALDRVFIFFTIQTNLAIALYYSAHLLPSRNRLARFFINPETEGCLAMSIIVVSAVFSVLLQWHLSHTGAAVAADRLLHFLTPAVYLIYWGFYTPRGFLHWGSPFRWLIFPLLYLAYVLARGHFSGRYPYPFMDVKKLGYVGVCESAAAFLGGFLIIGWGLVIIDKVSGVVRRRSVIDRNQSNQCDLLTD